jgi:hypothetical protein
LARVAAEESGAGLGWRPRARRIFTPSAISTIRRLEAQGKSASQIAEVIECERPGKMLPAEDKVAKADGWFTEGFDTRDLKEAKALLDTLAA